jgi:hypothetical protein
VQKVRTMGERKKLRPQHHLRTHGCDEEHQVNLPETNCLDAMAPTYIYYLTHKDHTVEKKNRTGYTASPNAAAVIPVNVDVTPLIPRFGPRLTRSQHDETAGHRVLQAYVPEKSLDSANCGRKSIAKEEQHFVL